MLREHRYQSAALVAVLLIGITIGALTLSSPPGGRGANRADAQPVELVAGPAMIEHSFGRLMEEPYGVTWSDGVFRGEVISVTTSTYNTPGGEFAPRVEEWYEDDLVEEFTPQRYYTVTFAVDEWWKNPGETESTVHILVNGYSPIDPPLTPMPEEVIFVGDYGHTWQVGDEAVVFVIGETFMDREIYQATLQLVYFISPGEMLTNVVSGKITRSTSVSQLYDIVDNNS